MIDKKVSEVLAIFSNELTFDSKRIDNLAQRMVLALKDERKIVFFGNGGSAAEAMHIAAEFSGKCLVDHAPLDVICLNESQSSLTGIANDFGVQEIFARMVEARVRNGDIVIALSTSGTSPNVMKGIEVAKQKKAQVILWTGNAVTEMNEVEVWSVPSASTPRVQEVHLVWGHFLAELVELEFPVQR
jgi:D-sedoheptulose 7-phosphate isomerase